jgi:hypothetical protein
MPTKPTKGPNFRWNGRVPNPVPKEKKSSNHNEIEGIALPTFILKLGIFCILMLLLVFFIILLNHQLNANTCPIKNTFDLSISCTKEGQEVFLYILCISICVDFSIPPFLCTALAV